MASPSRNTKSPSPSTRRPKPARKVKTAAGDVTIRATTYGSPKVVPAGGELNTRSKEKPSETCPHGPVLSRLLAELTIPLTGNGGSTLDGMVPKTSLPMRVLAAA